METEKTAHISQCIRQARESVSKQSERVKQLTGRDLCAHEERGILFIMVDRLDTLLKQRAQLLKASAQPLDESAPHHGVTVFSGQP